MNTPQPSGEISLPELPDRYRGSPTEVNGHPLRLFAAHQMKAYARAAILADRERSAGAVPVAWVNLLPGWDDSARRVFTDSEAAANYHRHCYDLTPVYDRPSPLVAKAEPLPEVVSCTGGFNGLTSVSVRYEGETIQLFRKASFVDQLAPQPSTESPAPAQEAGVTEPVDKASFTDWFGPSDSLMNTHRRQGWNAAIQSGHAPQPSTEAPGAAAEGWQPIATAPKDMAARLYRVRGVCVQGFVDATGALCVNSDSKPWRKMVGKPTHWMPLPAAPRLEVPADSTQGEQSHG